MTHQETKMRLADIWEHLNTCYQQWEQADEEGAQWLAGCLMRDFDECRRLCQAVGNGPSLELTQHRVGMVGQVH